MVILRVLFSLFLLSSCAKFSYIFEQGFGQLSLLANARRVEAVLKDEDIKLSQKEKIKKIQEYKKYFYKFWDRPSKKIYSKVTFLDQEAVTYLVIRSPYNEIKALEECFPIVGCFPYLGFFKKESAIDYMKDSFKEEKLSYMRPVYAYSTLGNFNDPILSSFFYFSEKDLAELVFHELFHTIFFAEDEVELNENMANFFAKRMKWEYFKNSGADIKRERDFDRVQGELKALVVSAAKELNQKYKTQKNLTMKSADKISIDYVTKKFKPRVRAFCKRKKIREKNCFPLKGKWGNARFAAFMTYQNKMNFLETLYHKKELSLKEFFEFIETSYKNYDKKDEGFKNFSSYLKDKTSL